MIFFFRKGLSVNEILDQLEDGDQDMVGVTDIFIEPPDDTDSDGNDGSGDEGEPGSLARSVLQVTKIVQIQVYQNIINRII